MGTNRVKMDQEQRAKQFLPFAALKGLPEALLQVEKEVNLSFYNEISCDTINGDCADCTLGETDENGR
ncbi:MAG: hypothetical protein MJ133_02110 [Lachnospiraceae bacterium]|nr:hypothetical protein [Lachnospiraceae bacterium]